MIILVILRAEVGLVASRIKKYIHIIDFRLFQRTDDTNTKFIEFDAPVYPLGRSEIIGSYFISASISEMDVGFLSGDNEPICQ